MTKNKTLTLDEIIDAAMERGIMQEHGLTTTTREQEIAYKRQQFLQWVADITGEDETHLDLANPARTIGRNEIRAEIRQILKDHGWKPKEE